MRRNNNHIRRPGHTFPDKEHDRMAELSYHCGAGLSGSDRNGHTKRTTQDPFGWQLGAGSHATSKFHQLVMRHPLYEDIGTIERAQVRASSFCVTVSRRLSKRI